MIYGRLKQVSTYKSYDENGKFIGEGAKYIYKPILLWRDVIIGLSIAFLVIHKVFMV